VSIENVTAFFEKAGKDKELKAKLLRILGKKMAEAEAVEELCGLAASVGITFTAADYAAARSSSELVDDHLRAVAGGTMAPCACGPYWGR
jgi:predicted ribosomally synthesized peptide with nif11-like leader